MTRRRLRAVGVAALLTLGPGAVQVVAQAGEPLTLDEAVRIALRTNVRIDRDEAAVLAAAADYRAGWGAFLPTASLNGGLGHSAFTTNSFANPDGTVTEVPLPVQSQSNASTQGLSLAFDVFDGGGRFADLRSRRAGESAALYRLSSTERTLSRDVKLAYYEALKQDHLVNVAGRQLEGRRRDLEVARRRYEIAAVNRTDVLGAEIEVLNAELALVQAQTERESAGRALQIQMGREPEPGELPSLADVPRAPSADRLDPPSLVAVALGTKPEISALEADVEAADAGVWRARSTYLPSVRVNYGYGRSESQGPRGDFFVLDPSNTSHSFSLTATWNLFDGFDREAQNAQARASARQRRADLTLRRLSLEQEVRDQIAELAARSRRLDIRERNLSVAQQRLDMMQERYRLGTVEYVDLLSAISQLTTAEQSVIQERYEYLKAWANLEEQVGSAAEAP